MTEYLGEGEQNDKIFYKLGMPFILCQLAGESIVNVQQTWMTASRIQTSQFYSIGAYPHERG